jgi:hypothetical protein
MSQYIVMNDIILIRKEGPWAYIIKIRFLHWKVSQSLCSSEKNLVLTSLILGAQRRRWPGAYPYHHAPDQNPERPRLSQRLAHAAAPFARCSERS